METSQEGIIGNNLKRRKVLGILIIIIAVGGLAIWEFSLREYALRDEIVVVEEDVQKGDKITAENLKLIGAKVKIKGAMSKEDRNKLIGKRAAQFIHKNAPIFKEYLLNNEETADKQEMILPIPERAIEARSKHLKKGSLAVVFSNGNLISKYRVWRAAIDEGDVEIIVNNQEAKNLSNIIATGEGLVIGCKI